jgi:transcription elongation factor GreB
MNEAFTKDDQPDLPVVPPRAPLPDGVPNYVTPRGLSLLKAEMEGLDAERSALDDLAETDRRLELSALAQRRVRLAERIANAVVVESPRAGDDDVVRFGARVRVRRTDGTESLHEIVGVDEADAGRGRIAFTSPIARALIGKSAGDVAIVETPRGKDELEVIAVTRTDE